MSVLIKNIIHNTLVDAVYNEILSRRSNYYYYIGKIIEWTDPNTPETPVDTASYEHEIRNRIISIKRLNLPDVSYIVPRIDWTSGIVYDMYDGDYSEGNPSYSGATNIRNARFYVLTTSYGVFKCLFNNNNAPSTEEPFGTSPLPITTSDGYVWKYLYTIPLSNRTRFLNSTYMPVQRAVTNAYYSSGQIDRVVVNNRGTGYDDTQETTLTVNGQFAGSSGNSIANLIAVVSAGGQIEKVVIKDRGNNYVTANISITDSGGSGTSYYKGLSNVSIYEQGTGYDSNVIPNTTATVSTTGSSQPESNAKVLLLFANGSVVDFVIENNGSGYTPSVIANTTIAVVTTGDSQPTQNATANLNFANSAILTPVLLNGQIDRVLIEDPGSGYSSNIQTIIVTTGDGANASFLPYVNSSGEIEDVIILNRGLGYSYANLTVVGDGSNADLTAELSSGDLDSVQGAVELSAINGAIYAFKINHAGNNYTSANIVLTGDGTGFLGNVVLSNTNTISKIEVINPGIGYTYANVSIVGNGTNANASAIISPYGGHGKDAIDELYADTLMLYSTISVEKIHNIDVNNDYRQYGIIKDPTNYDGTRVFSNTLGTPCFLVTLDTLTDSTSNTLSDDTILQLNTNKEKKFEVVETVSGNTQALLTSLNNYDIQVNDILNDVVTDSNFRVTAVNQTPTINKFSGELIYVDNRTRISYSENQLVTLRTILRL